MGAEPRRRRGAPPTVPVVGGGAGRTRELVELRLESFLDALAAEGPIPAGGAAAAVTTALAASLVEMAAASSPDWEGSRGVAAQARSLRDRVVPLAQADSEAYAAVLEALDRPELPADARSDFALGRALERAAALPLAIAEAAADVVELSAHGAGRCAGAVRGEVLTAAVLAESVVRAARGLVAMNLATTEGDERLERAGAAVAAAGDALRRVEGSL